MSASVDERDKGEGKDRIDTLAALVRRSFCLPPLNLI